MARDIVTLKDMLRHTAARIGISVGVSATLTPLMVWLFFGSDQYGVTNTRHLLIFSVVTAVAISSLLAGGLTYRSAHLMRELASARAELLRISRTDHLTGIWNRRGFDHFSVEALRLSGGEAAVLMCDIDNFKLINDRHGHEFGDVVLIAIADVFRKFAEDAHAIAARHGGEEFVLLVTGSAASTIHHRAEFLRSRCATTIGSDGVSAPVTVSIGYASAGGDTQLDRLMRRADEALYMAKRSGRNCVAGARSPDVMKAA